MGYGDLSCQSYGILCDEDYRKVRQSQKFSSDETAYMLAGDNKAAIAMSQNPVMHKRSKHINCVWNLTQEQRAGCKGSAGTYIHTNNREPRGSVDEESWATATSAPLWHYAG